MNVIAAALYFLVENPLNQLIRGESKILKYLSA